MQCNRVTQPWFKIMDSAFQRQDGSSIVSILFISSGFFLLIDTFTLLGSRSKMVSSVLFKFSGI